MLIVYEKKLKVVGITNILIAVILLILYLSAEQYVFEKPEMKTTALLFFSFASFILSILIIVFLLRGIGLLFLGGKWRIELTNKYISWEVPQKSNFLVFKSDDTFFIPIEELKEVIFDCGLSKGADDIYQTKCIFINFKGEKYTVSRESGVDLESLVNKLTGLGLKISRI